MDSKAPDQQSKRESIFLAGAKDPDTRSFTPWLIAGVVVLLIVGVLLFSSRSHKDTNSAAPDAYAAKIAIGAIALSQSSNMAGSQITYVDGTITNQGDRVVTGIVVQTTFHEATGLTPQIESSNLNLIRTRDPYIDIQPVSANPIKPGESREFRLIFDRVTPEWDQKTPDIRVMRVLSR